MPTYSMSAFLYSLLITYVMQVIEVVSHKVFHTSVLTDRIGMKIVYSQGIVTAYIGKKLARV